MEEKKFLPPHLLTYDGWTRAPLSDFADWWKKAPLMSFHKCGTHVSQMRDDCPALERQPPHARDMAKTDKKTTYKCSQIYR